MNAPAGTVSSGSHPCGERNARARAIWPSGHAAPYPAFNTGTSVTAGAALPKRRRTCVATAAQLTLRLPAKVGLQQVLGAGRLKAPSYAVRAWRAAVDPGRIARIGCRSSAAVPS
jgi:hypothetical protein